MTVIATIQEKSTKRLWVFSDTLVSKSIDGNAPRLNTPINRRGGVLEGIEEVGLRRKIVRVCENLTILFAGRIIDAISLVKTIKESEKEFGALSSDTLKRCIDENYSKSDLINSSFIFLLKEHGFIKTATMNCKRIESSKYIIYHSGSGDFFIQNPDLIFEDKEVCSLDAENDAFPLKLLLNFILRNSFDSMYPYFAAGGWYEIGVVTPNGIKFLNYQILALPDTSSFVGPPFTLIWSLYMGDTLVVCDIEEVQLAQLEGKSFEPSNFFKFIPPIWAMDHEVEMCFDFNGLVNSEVDYCIVISAEVIEKKVKVSTSMRSGNAFSKFQILEDGFEFSLAEGLKHHLNDVVNN